MACRVPPAFVYATGGRGCAYLETVDRIAILMGRRPLYCDRPRADPATSYCARHAALCETRLPRRGVTAAAIALRVPT
jgi:hypothetical protein